MDDVRRLIGGRAPKGEHPTLAAELVTWLIHQEGHRNIAALPAHTMLIDVAGRSNRTIEELIREDWLRTSDNERGRFTMQPLGSQGRARILADYLDRTAPGRPGGGESPGARWEGRAEANRLAVREVEMIKLWIDSLEDFKVADETAARSRQDELILEIRRRVQQIWGMSPDEVGTSADFLRSLEHPIGIV
jgi:hypothetical protein